MLGSAGFIALFGAAHPLRIHSMAYFSTINALQGLLQCIGWPCVVAVMARWFGQSTRGAVMGVWNSHTSVGNILGGVLATAALSAGMDGHDWPAAFYTVAGLLAAVGLLVAAFLLPSPAHAGIAILPGVLRTAAKPPATSTLLNGAARSDAAAPALCLHGAVAGSGVTADTTAADRGQQGYGSIAPRSEGGAHASHAPAHATYPPATVAPTAHHPLLTTHRPPQEVLMPSPLPHTSTTAVPPLHRLPLRPRRPWRTCQQPTRRERHAARFAVARAPTKAGMPRPARLPVRARPLPLSVAAFESARETCAVPRSSRASSHLPSRSCSRSSSRTASCTGSRTTCGTWDSAWPPLGT